MGYVLLLVENLTAAILLLAFLVACLGHWQRRRLRVALAGAVALLVLALYLVLTGLVGYLKFTVHMASGWFYPLVALTASFTVAAVWILIAGLRRTEAGLSDAPSANWPRGRLAVALAVVVLLHLMTVWNLDLAIQQRLATLRAEAGALALSVAPPRLPDRDNGALVYQQAFQAMGDPASWPEAYEEKWCKWAAAGDTGFDPKDAELRAFLVQQTAALALLREAADKPGCYFDRDYGRPSIGMLLPEMQRLREAARLLSLDARRKAADGNLRGALGDCRVILAMAEHVAGDSLLISLLVSAAIEDMAVSTLEVVLASGLPSANDLDEVDLDESFSYQRGFHRALRMEEAFGQTVFYDLAMGKISLASWDDFTGARPSSRAACAFSSLYRLFLLEDDQAAYCRLMEQYQQWASRPYFQSRSDRDGAEWKIRNQSGVLTRMLLPALSHCAERVARADAQHSLARFALATYRFQADRGRLPDKTDELAPDFILAVPQDPFDGRPLRMKKTDHGMVLYSIGPDMTDDGGTTFDPATRMGDITFTVKEKDSKARSVKD